MALVFTFLGVTNHEMVYLVTGDGFGDLDAAGGPSPDMLTDSLNGTPLRRFVQQDVPDQAAARKLVFGEGLGGESTVPPRQIGEAYVQGLTDNIRWDLDADTDGLGHLRLRVTADLFADESTARLRVRIKHTFDR